MICRIGFRRLLPILFTLIHLALLLNAGEKRDRASSTEHSTSASIDHLVAYQENSIPWEPQEPKSLMLGEKLGIVLNLPAFILAIPITLWLFQGSDVGLFYASLPFVPFVWYGVGRWLDGVMGYIQRSHRVRRVWRRLFLVFSSSLLFLSIVMVNPINHHRTMDAYWVGFAIMLWSALFLVVNVSGSIRQLHCC